MPSRAATWGAKLFTVALQGAFRANCGTLYRNVNLETTMRVSKNIFIQVQDLFNIRRTGPSKLNWLNREKTGLCLQVYWLHMTQVSIFVIMRLYVVSRKRGKHWSLLVTLQGLLRGRLQELVPFAHSYSVSDPLFIWLLYSVNQNFKT